MGNSGVDHHVFIRQWGIVFRICFATADLSILLFHLNYIGEPGWVVDGLKSSTSKTF